MKYSKILFVVLAIILFFATIRSYSSEDKFKNHKTTYTQTNKDEKNLKHIIISSEKWETYIIDNPTWEVRINRGGTYDLKLRWKTRSEPKKWKYGEWKYRERSDIYDISDLIIVEFKLMPGNENIQLKVYQRKY